MMQFHRQLRENGSSTTPASNCVRGRKLSGSRFAFTLFEVLVVLTIIAVIASLSWPRLMIFMRRQQVKSGASAVRARLDLGRVFAVNEGLTYQFRYEPHGRKFVLLPYDIITKPESANEVTRALTDEEGTQTKLAKVYELPEGCSFHVPQAILGEAAGTERLHDGWLAFLMDGNSHRDTTWSEPILYNPDGTASDGVITVIDEKRMFVTLVVRGLTATVAVSKAKEMSAQDAGFGAVVPTQSQRGTSYALASRSIR